MVSLKRACEDCPRPCSDPINANVLCEHAERQTLILGAVCVLDHSFCSNFCRQDLINCCPTLRAMKNGEPVGKIMDFGYVGPKHVVRTGPYGSFAAQMPPEYMMGDLRKEKKKEEDLK